MKELLWDKVIMEDFDAANTLFQSGCAITIGSYDGPHIGHKYIFDKTIDEAKKIAVPAVLITFREPLPAIKHSSDYLGDIATFEQRFAAYQKFGFDYCVVVDFSYNFSKMRGRDFLQLLRNRFNMRVIVEGVDFHFGCNGSYDDNTISTWAAENNVACHFIDLITCKRAGIDTIDDDGETKKNRGRVSASYIRGCIHDGNIAEANGILCSPYELDLRGVSDTPILTTSKQLQWNKAYFTQVVPNDGVFDAKCVCKKIDNKGDAFLLRTRLDASTQMINLVELDASEAARIESVIINN